MNILVTGSRGMLGTALVNNLKNIKDNKNRTRPNIHIEEIYEYDSYNLRIVDADDKPVVGSNEFIIGCVYYENGIMNVLDERIYCMFNQRYEQETEYTGNNSLQA